MTAGSGLPSAGRRGQDLEEEIRSITRAGVAGLDPARMANVIIGEDDDYLLREASGAPKDPLAAAREEAQALAEEDALEAVRERYADYFGAAERVAKTESAADLNRFKALRRKQLGLARAADGAAAGAAERLVFIGIMLPLAALLGRYRDLFSMNTLLALWALSLILYLVGRKLRARRKSLLWSRVFSNSNSASLTVWFSAAEAAAVQLIRRRERDSAEHEPGLRAAEAAWAARDRRSSLFSAEDYSVLNAA